MEVVLAVISLPLLSTVIERAFNFGIEWTVQMSEEISDMLILAFLLPLLNVLAMMFIYFS